VDKVTIAVSRQTAERLKHLGVYGDTMETILKRVVDEYEKMCKQNLLQRVILGGALSILISATSLSFMGI
jgi:hypothetical protein